MKVTILTLFPEIFPTLLDFSILKRAQKKGLFSYQIIDLRPFGEGIHQIVDDKPFGGGAGMVFKADILAKALKSINYDPQQTKVILTSASGKLYQQKIAKTLSQYEQLIIICGHYEGVDQRFIDKYVDLEISIGDYVLTGGEIPALIITDSVVRLIKGVLNKEESLEEESFENNLLEYPHYTRPQEFEGETIPEVLISGNHAAIKKWHHEKALAKTQENRPELLKITEKD